MEDSMAQETTTTDEAQVESAEERGRFDRAREAVASASGKVKEKVAEASENVKKTYASASEKAKEAGESAKKAYASASEKAKERYGQVREKVEDLEIEKSIEQARDWVRKNPGKAVLFSVGVGFLIGLILRRDDD